jgi:hypothetical protein
MRGNSFPASTQAVKLTRLTGLVQKKLRNAVAYKLHSTLQSKILESFKLNYIAPALVVWAKLYPDQSGGLQILDARSPCRLRGVAEK